MEMKHHLFNHRIEVNASLHEKLLKSPIHAQKEKIRLYTLSILSCVIIALNVYYFMASQEKMTENQILESQYANFGSDLSI
jgi:hypothetical protein